MTDTYKNYMLTFQEIIQDASEFSGKDEEEVIRDFVNSRWDIRECLNYKDIVSINEIEEEENVNNI